MTRISTLTLHRYRNNELSPAEAEAVRTHLRACPEDQARLDAQEAQRRAFVLEPMPLALQNLREPARAPWWRLAVLVFAAAAAMLLAFPRHLPTDAASTVEITRSKGVPTLDVLVEGKGTWSPGQRLHAGDRVQLRVPAGPYAEAWVTDGQAVLGRFDLHHGEPTLAPFALTLDDAPGDQKVVVLMAKTALSPEEAAAALKRPDPARVEALSLTLPKAHEQ